MHFRVTLAFIWPEAVNVAIAVAAWTGLALRDRAVGNLLLGRRR